jgi:hypothetical protein
MKIKEAREEHAFYSGKLSDILRQLGLAGLAIIWVFRIESPRGNSIPRGLIPAGWFLLLGLTADLLHYAAGTIFWDRFSANTAKELEEIRREVTPHGKQFDPEEEDFAPPPHRNRWTRRFFWIKFTLMMLAYVWLISYLVIRFVLSM